MISRDIRNFVIISHIDHGKSTLADRFLEITGAIAKEKLREQYLDRMSLEREKGITIKMHPVRMPYILNSESYILNLIDTPGHADFSYEVFRSLKACEGAILLVDASQGIQAQTLANYSLAKKEGLTIIPVINKIDLPNIQIEQTINELADLTGAEKNEIILISAKSGTNVEKVLTAVVKKIPAPLGDIDKPLKALVFDSLFDQHRGVIAFVRIFDGEVRKGDEIKLLATGKKSKVLEVGYFKPDFFSQEKLSAGEIGYIIAGFKEVRNCRVGDTITISGGGGQISDVEPLQGYQEPPPMVFASFYCADSSDYSKFREAMGKLSLNDAAFTFKTESFSPSAGEAGGTATGGLGFGFRCGFLGMLHLEIIKERLAREYGLDLIAAAPSVSYKIILRTGEEKNIHSAQEFPAAEQIKEIQEPWIEAEIFAPAIYLSLLIDLAKKFRGIYKKTEYLADNKAGLFLELPLASFLANFYDELKNASAGYASLNYQFLEYRPADLVKIEIRIAGKPMNAFSSLVFKNEIYSEAKRLTGQLKKLIPRQLFEIAIQACVNSQIISRETVPALRKNVTAKLYGGDRTRKEKLWKKQQAGKKKLKEMGSVKIPAEAFFAVLKRE